MTMPLASDRRTDLSNVYKQSPRLDLIAIELFRRLTACFSEHRHDHG